MEIEIISERQVYAPRLKPVAPICPADQNHAHCPSIAPSHRPQKKDGSMTDFKHARSDPHRSHV